MSRALIVVGLRTNEDRYGQISGASGRRAKMAMSPQPVLVQRLEYQEDETEAAFIIEKRQQSHESICFNLLRLRPISRMTTLT
jgi:hypothetical protein